MFRYPLAIFVGAIVLFVWGMVAWMVFGIHDASIRQVPDEEDVRAFLIAKGLRTGMYVLPYLPSGANTEMMERFTATHEAGPILTISYRETGAPMMGPSVMLGGFLINLAVSAIAVYFCSLAGRAGASFAERVLVVVLLGFAITGFSQGNYWNWMYFPLDHTLAMIFDTLIGFTLLALVLVPLVPVTHALARKSD